MAVDSENPAHSAELPDDRIFREARASDEAAIREILAHANLSSGAVEKSPGANSTHIGSTFVHVCQQDGAVVAVVQWRNLGEEAEILDIAVAEKHRRHGNARFLLKKFVERRLPGSARIKLSGHRAVPQIRIFHFRPPTKLLSTSPGSRDPPPSKDSRLVPKYLSFPLDSNFTRS